MYRRRADDAGCGVERELFFLVVGGRGRERKRDWRGVDGYRVREYDKARDSRFVRVHKSLVALRRYDYPSRWIGDE